MQIAEYTFQESADSHVRQEVMNVTAGCETLDALIDEWVLRRDGGLSIGEALDDDGTLMPTMVALGFDDTEGKEICCAVFQRAELEALYPGVPSVDTYVRDGFTKWGDREFDDEAWNSWLASLGMSESFALMARIGPRSAALSYSLAFVLSGGGVVEICRATDPHSPDEDMLADLAEENLNLDECFRIVAAYRNPKHFKKGHQWMMDSVYFRRVEQAVEVSSRDKGATMIEY